jgi:hypothetical protein
VAVLAVGVAEEEAGHVATVPRLEISLRSEQRLPLIKAAPAREAVAVGVGVDPQHLLQTFPRTAAFNSISNRLPTP